MGLLRPGVNVPDLQIFLHTDPALQHAPHDAAHLRIHRNAAGHGHDLSLLHEITDPGFRLQFSVRRRADQPFNSVAAYISRHAGVRDGTAAADHIAQRMAPFRLYHTVAVLPGCKSRPHADDKGRVRDPGPHIPLRQDRVDEHIRLIPVAAGRLFVHHDGDIPVRQDLLRRLPVCCQYSRHILHLSAPLADRPGKCHGPAHRKRLPDLCHQDLMAGSIKPGCDPGGQVARSSDQYFHTFPPVTMIRRIPSPASIRQILSAACLSFSLSALFKTTVYTAPSGQPFRPAL